MPLQLEYKENFQQCRDFWTGWWERPQEMRPALIGAVPKPGEDPVPFPSVLGLLERNIDDFARQVQGWLDTHLFPGDTVPAVVVSFGADHFAALLGADLLLDLPHHTAWVAHCVDDWDRHPLKVDWDCRVGRRTLECIRELRWRFDGKLLVSPTHLQGNLDCLAALRGVQPLRTQAIRARVVIDATGDADVAARAGAPVDEGSRNFGPGLYFAMNSGDMSLFRQTLVKDIARLRQAVGDAQHSAGSDVPV